MPFDAEVTTKSRDQIVLEKARTRVAKRWKQHGGIRRCASDPWCMLVACTDIDTAHFVPYFSLSPFARLLGFETWTDAVEWNDAPGRTQAEVLARFDAAIERLSHA